MSGQLSKAFVRLGKTFASPEAFTSEFHDLRASRLRIICLFGVIIVPAFFVMDVVHATWAGHDVPLGTFVVLRLAFSVYYLGMYVLLWRFSLAERGLTIVEWVLFPPLCVFTSVLGLWTGGIASPYYAGVILIILARCLLVPGGLLRAAAIVLACWWAYPLSVGIAAWVSPEVAAQFDSAADLGLFVANNLFVAFSIVLSLIGAGVVNRLQLREYRLHRIGRYRITGKLGEGGMGIVFLARHGILKRSVAIKVLGSRREVTDILRARFEREAMHTSQLSHPNTIQIFDYGQSEDGRLFYAMEYVEGLDLRRIVDEFGPIPPGRSVHLLVQACRSIHHAHENGVIHRDIKPENCIASGTAAEPDFLKVLDFGLAKVLRRDGEDPELSRSDAVLGTPYYMAPEACLSMPVDRRSDVYSLGCMLYYLLTGLPTFRADSWMQVMYLHTSEPPEPPSNHNAAIPKDLEEVVLRCLAKDPDHRYSTAAELGDALLDCAAASQWSPKHAAAWWNRRGNFAVEVLQATSLAPNSTTIDVSVMERIAGAGISGLSDPNWSRAPIGRTTKRGDG